MGFEGRATTDALGKKIGAIIPWVFHRTKRGHPLKGFTKSWRAACVAAGVPGRIPHDFRRTAVRNLERAGVPRSTAMAMVGHRTEAIYRRYAIVDEVMLHEGGAKLAAYAEGKERTMRAEVEKFLEETGLGNDEQFIREAAAKGAPLRQEVLRRRGGIATGSARSTRARANTRTRRRPSPRVISAFTGDADHASAPLAPEECAAALPALQATGRVPPCLCRELRL